MEFHAWIKKRQKCWPDSVDAFSCRPSANKSTLVNSQEGQRESRCARPVFGLSCKQRPFVLLCRTRRAGEPRYQEMEGSERAQDSFILCPSGFQTYAPLVFILRASERGRNKGGWHSAAPLCTTPFFPPSYSRARRLPRRLHARQETSVTRSRYKPSSSLIHRSAAGVLSATAAPHTLKCTRCLFWLKSKCVRNMSTVKCDSFSLGHSVANVIFRWNLFLWGIPSYRFSLALLTHPHHHNHRRRRLVLLLHQSTTKTFESQSY